jgi:hypothetical protein
MLFKSLFALHNSPSLNLQFKMQLSILPISILLAATARAAVNEPCIGADGAAGLSPFLSSNNESTNN